jgi:glycosyltransferase involved in cell wall biosynthesis
MTNLRLEGLPGNGVAAARPRVAMVHAFLKMGGGPEAITMATIEALRDLYEISLITYSPRVDLEAFNSFYGTTVRERDFAIRRVPPPLFMRTGALMGGRISKCARKWAREYHLVFSVYNGMDFGTKGLQYFHDPSFDADLVRKLNPDTRKARWLYRDGLPRRIYLGLANRLARSTPEGIRRNRTIANSRWTAELVKRHLGIDSVVIYPPVPDPPGRPDWAEREDGFVTLGRLSPDKNIEGIVAILRVCRAKHPGLHLHVIGRNWDPAYTRRLEEALRGDRSWIFFEKDVSFAAKDALIGRHRYGIHGKTCEPFGISIAELVKAGCIAWVPNGGGQVEIVGHPKLIYENGAQAAASIDEVLSSASLQADLRRSLAERSRNFSTSRFAAEIRGLVGAVLKEGPARDGGQ